jgi:hypothetical protein
VFLFPPLIVVPLSSHEVDGVRKEKERLTAAIMIADWELLPAVHNIGALCWGLYVLSAVWQTRTRQADTKDLTSSSKFSACCVLTLQTILIQWSFLDYGIAVVLRSNMYLTYLHYYIRPTISPFIFLVDGLWKKSTIKNITNLHNAITSTIISPLVRELVMMCGL